MPQKPLEGAQLAWMTVALAMATFMQVLDSTIANVAIPTISGNLGSSNSQGTWVITSFGVANAISIPITGWLAKRFGEVRLFLWSTALFALASWLCGISNSLGMLIFFRVIQGVVAGPLIPLSQSLLLNNYPPAKRAMALALWSMTVIVAPIFGPILGGYISDNYHWGWIFFINIPIGVFVIVAAMATLKGRETKTEIKPIDTVGLVLLIVGIGSLQIMLDQGKELDWFNSTDHHAHRRRGGGAAVPGGVGADGRPSGGGSVAVQVAQLHHRLPVYQPRLHAVLRRHRAVAAAAARGVRLYRHLGGAGVGAGWADPVLLSPIIGKFGNRLDMRRLVTFSFIMYAVCFYWRAYTFEPGMDFGASAWPQFVQGFAIACFFMPLTTITLSGLPPERMAAASSLSNFTRTLAGSIGTSITTTLWTQRESQHHSQLTEFVNPYNPQSQEMYRQLEQLGMSKQQASAYIANEITAQGLIISANEIFWLSAGVFLVLLVLVWVAKPPFSSGGGGAAALTKLQ